MGYGRQRYQSRTGSPTTFGLNITSMTDMFTILLVFLLQTYNTSDVQINPEQGLNLPVSNAEANPVQSLKVSLSTTELKIEGKTIVALSNADFTKSDIDPNDANFILPLFRELEKIAKENSAKDAAKGEKKSQELDEGKILLQADQGLPYQVLRKVMYTASMAGFPKLKLATVMGN